MPLYSKAKEKEQKMRIIRNHLFLTYFLIWSTSLNGQDELVIEKDIDIGLQQMHYCIIGNGSPTLVLDVGIGNTYRDWLPFLKRIGEKVRIFCYNRAGYGQSEIGKMPRDSKTEADELKLLLDKANIKGPFILLGHSLGALNLQLFASKYKEDISGILLLDPPPLEWILGNGFPQMRKLAEKTTNNFKNISESLINSNNKNDRQKSDFFKTLASEHRNMFSNSAKQVEAITSFGEKRLIVIASGKANPEMGKEAKEFQKFWNDQCKKLASKSKNGEYILASESGHQIQNDNPEIVLKALKELLLKK